MLNRMVEEKPELKGEKLSYAGRLDPMAEGEMLVLVGDENKEYKKYLGYDKEYEAVFVAKIKTDTGDVLGLITEEGGEVSDLEKQIGDLKNIKKQKYPWFSSKTVGGIKLFDHFKKGNLDLERPEREVCIREADLIETQEISSNEAQEYLIESVKRVNGDFRQEEILSGWEKYFNNHNENIFIFKVMILVSTGTYIRGLTENFDFPCMLFKLKRTKIFTRG